MGASLHPHPQLAARRREQQGTTRALWFWAFSLQAKVSGASLATSTVRGPSPIGAEGGGVDTAGACSGPDLPLALEVWAAWLGFVVERRRKKARLAWAAQVYQQHLLREGVPRLLRFAAGMKAHRQRLHARQQAQVGVEPLPAPAPSVGCGGTHSP